MEPIPLSLRGRADPFDRATFLDADVEPDRPRPHLPGREIIHLVCQGEPTPGRSTPGRSMLRSAPSSRWR